MSIQEYYDSTYQGAIFSRTLTLILILSVIGLLITAIVLSKKKRMTALSNKGTTVKEGSILYSIVSTVILDKEKRMTALANKETAIRKVSIIYTIVLSVFLIVIFFMMTLPNALRLELIKKDIEEGGNIQQVTIIVEDLREHGYILITSEGRYYSDLNDSKTLSYYIDNEIPITIYYYENSHCVYSIDYGETPQEED